MKNDVLLSVRELSKSFHSSGRTTRALEGVSFDILRSEIFGLVGESGSGKSTTGRIICGMYEPDRGEVRFDGELIRAGERELRERIKEGERTLRRRNHALRKEVLIPRENGSSERENKHNVNIDLQKSIENDRERLKLAVLANRKYGRSSHPDIRMVFQDPSASLNPRMTVGESVGEALYAVGFRDRAEIGRRVREALSSVGLPRSAEVRYPLEFSGGQRQRVGIARAIITRPKLLIADEPISALDVSVGAQVINLLGQLAREMSLSVLFIAHDLSVVRHICSRVGVMHRARLVELAGSEALFTGARHPYTRALLSAAPPPDPRTAKSLVHLPPPEDYSTEGGLVDIGGGHFVLGGDIYES